MWSGLTGGQARAARPAPRAPRNEELRSDHRGGQPCGQGAVRPVVSPASQAGGGLVSPVSPISTYSRAKKRTERSRATALTGLTTWTGSESHRVEQASRSRVPAQRPDRACTGASCLAARHRGSVLALRSSDRAGHAVRRRAPRPGRWSRPVEPRTRVRAVQPSRRWPDGCRRHELAARPIGTSSPGSAGWSARRRRARAVVTAVFFEGRCNPRLRLHKHFFPLNWRFS